MNNKDSALNLIHARMMIQHINNKLEEYVGTAVLHRFCIVQDFFGGLAFDVAFVLFVTNHREPLDGVHVGQEFLYFGWAV